METLLYTAELIEEGGTYTLVISDRLRNTVQTTQIAKKAVEKLPMFLSMLNSKQVSGCR
ncbi:hypothetical protein [Streptomyces sp. NPDC053427]|uniref:hypothetical protein n=1 Tax=Streptomyces sp. NPDC053427 TaxID=3365701 RepID=UPI0037D2EC51